MAEHGQGDEGGPRAIPSSYADIFHIRGTVLDFKIAFAQRLLAVGDDGKIKEGDAVSWVHEVTMSPQAAKQLSQLLSGQIADYEKEVGEIKGVSLSETTVRSPRKKAKGKKAKGK